MTIELIISIISAAAAVAALFLPLLKKNGGKETKINNVGSSFTNIDKSVRILNDNRKTYYSQTTQINNYPNGAPASTNTNLFPIYITLTLTTLLILTASYIEQNSWIVILVAFLFVLAFAILSYFKDKKIDSTADKVFVFIAFIGLIVSRFNLFAPIGFATSVIGIPINLSALVITPSDTLVYLFGKTLSFFVYFYYVTRCIIKLFRKSVKEPVAFKTLTGKIIFLTFLFLFTSNLIFALVSIFFN